MMMTSLFNSKGRIMTIALLFTGLVFASCKKDTPVTHTPAAGFVAFNLIPDQGPIGIDIDAKPVTSTPLLFPNYTGSYLGVFAGPRTVKTYDYQSGNVLGISTEDFKDSAYYSLFVMGANNQYQNVFVQDKFSSLPSGTGKAFFRYVNAIPDSSKLNVKVTASDNTEVSNKDESFGTVSSFQGVDPGNFDVGLSNTTTQIDTSRVIPMEANGIYTILLVGLSNATDTTQAVKIWYIKNGNLTP